MSDDVHDAAASPAVDTGSDRATSAARRAGSTLRLAQMPDYPALVALLDQLDSGSTPAPATGREVLARILDTPGLELVVAEAEAGIVATCYLNIVPNLTRGGRPYALIENVVTDTAFRGRGHGRAVVEHAVARAFAAGCYKIVLTTSHADPAVHAFYAACGFSGDDKHAFVRRAP